MTKRVYGIDLGTTYSCISYVDEHGKPVVVYNAEGELTTPSVVYFESPENVVVGRTAKEVAKIHPDRVVSTIKRHMGDPNYSFSVDGKAYRPEEISSHILMKLVRDAQAVTGDEIKDVVITCPAYFGPTQREATKLAGTIAGLNVLFVISEPVAAAIAYGMEMTKEQNILVYDLGGGTFDITLVSISGGEIAERSTGGDNLLGGKDWDDDLVNYMARAFEEQTGTPAADLLAEAEAQQELMGDAEKIKIRLTAAKSVMHRVRHGVESANINVSREKLDEITRHLLERTIGFTEKMIDRAKELGIARIDNLLLVGGSTYMPQVGEAVAKFGIEVKQFDPNQAVAKGAAIFGYKYVLEDMIKIRVAAQTGQSAEQVDLQTVPSTVRAKAEAAVATEQGVPLPGLRNLLSKRISHVASRSFGVVFIADRATKREAVRNLIVVEDKLPREVSRSFQTLEDDQSGVEIRVMQNHVLSKPDEEVALSACEPDPIGIVALTFERGLPSESPIEVLFNLTEDGRLFLRARDLTTHREVEAEFKTEAVMSKEEVEEAKSRAQSMAAPA